MSAEPRADGLTSSKDSKEEVSPRNYNSAGSDGGNQVDYSSLFDKLRGNTADSFLMIEQEIGRLLGSKSENDENAKQLQGLQQHLELLKQRLQTDVEATETLVRGGEKVWNAVSLNQSLQSARQDDESISSSKSASNKKLPSTAAAKVVQRGLKEHQRHMARESMRRQRREKNGGHRHSNSKVGKPEGWMTEGTEYEFMLEEEELLDEDFEPPMYEPTSPRSSSPRSSSSPPMHLAGASKKGVRDGEARRILRDLQEELRWVDENAMRSRVDSERRLVSMLRDLETRIVFLEAEVDRHAKAGSKGAPISSALEQRLAYLESIAESVESQGSIVQGLARKVEHSVQQIEHQATMSSNVSTGSNSSGGSPGEKWRKDASIVSKGSQHDTVNGIVTNAAQSLEDSMRVRMKAAVHAMDVGRQGEASRLEGKLRDVAERVEFLETKIAEDHETSVQVLEVILKERAMQKHQRR